MATWFWRHQCKPHTTCSTPCTRCASPGAAQVDKKTLTSAPWISSTGPAPARTGIRNSNVSRWIYGQPQDFQLPAVCYRLLTLPNRRLHELNGRLFLLDVTLSEISNIDNRWERTAMDLNIRSRLGAGAGTAHPSGRTWSKANITTKRVTAVTVITSA